MRGQESVRYGVEPTAFLHTVWCAAGHRVVMWYAHQRRSTLHSPSLPDQV